MNFKRSGSRTRSILPQTQKWNLPRKLTDESLHHWVYKEKCGILFSLIRDADVRLLLDVRLNNVSQLAGFAKKDDLKFFTREICHIGYEHVPQLAPTHDLLGKYKKQKGDWKEYEQKFLELMRNRRIEQSLSKEMVAGACLLCSEDKPHFCHRRLVAEYLRDTWGGVDIVHLV